MTEAPPVVTIGMPTYNREWSLEKVLESVLAFDYDKKRIRICFVDNISTDGTLRILERFRAQHVAEYESIVIKEMSSNIPKARNAIFDLASGTYCVFFLDSDIVAPRDAVSRLVGLLRADPSVGICSLPWDRVNSMKRAGRLYGAFKVPPGPHEAFKVGNGCNMVLMKAYEEVGYFNERLRVHEDGEFCYRMRRRHYKIICDFSSEAVHLRGIDVNTRFYLNFMKDSANTYREMLARGSALHWLKLLGVSLGLAAIAATAFWPSALTVSLLAASVLFSIWLNSSPFALDDGARTRAPYVPVVGTLLTVATTGIFLILLYNLLSGRR